MSRKTYPLYPYGPSKAGAIIFAMLFFGTTCFHLFQMFKRRSWFMIALIIGGYAEFVGYACRAASSFQPHGQYTLYPFAIQNSYILLAPALFAASVYMVLGRVIMLTDGERHALVRSKRLTMTFVGGDVLCFAIQGGGGSLSTMAAFNPNISSIFPTAGKALTIFGLVLQLAVFAFFMVVAGTFHYRMCDRPTPASLSPAISSRWRGFIKTLYIASVLIMIRNLVRVVEYCQGTEGYIMTHEAFLYIFDALLMFVAFAYLNWKHPGDLRALLQAKAMEASTSIECGLMSDRGSTPFDDEQGKQSYQMQ